MRWLLYPMLLLVTASLVGLYERHHARIPSPPKDASPAPSEYVDAIEGDCICRPGDAAWTSPGSNAFVIVASSTCTACLATIPFDEELYGYAKARGIPVFYVFPDKPENRARERELALSGRNVIRVHSLRDFGLARVPTVARVDDRGIIQSRWTGSVPEKDHESVLASLTSGHGIQTYARIATSEMKQFVREKHAQVLAFSEINKDPDIVPQIIPHGQVYVRAKREMDPNIVTVVDCGSSLSAYSCQDAGLNLAIAHFREVVLSGLPTRATSCSK